MLANDAGEIRLRYDPEEERKRCVGKVSDSGRSIGNARTLSLSLSCLSDGGENLKIYCYCDESKLNYQTLSSHVPAQKIRK